MWRFDRGLGGIGRWAGAAIALCALWAAPVRAELATAHLVVQRPAESFCPTHAVIEGDVNALSGRRVFVPEGEADLEVQCVIEDDREGARAQVEVRDGAGRSLGTRELRAEGDGCASLRKPLSLVLSMWLDREPPPEAPQPAVAPARRAVPLGLGVAFAGNLGALPRITPGFGAWLDVGVHPHLDLRFAGAYWLPVHVRTSGASGARIQAFGVGAELCPSLAVGVSRVRLGLCTGAQLLGLTGTAYRLVAGVRDTVLLGQARLYPEISLAFRRMRLAAGAGPTLAFSRPRLLIRRPDGSDRVAHVPDRFGLQLQLGLIISLR